MEPERIVNPEIYPNPIYADPTDVRPVTPINIDIPTSPGTIVTPDAEFIPTQRLDNYDPVIEEINRQNEAERQRYIDAERAYIDEQNRNAIYEEQQRRFNEQVYRDRPNAPVPGSKPVPIPWDDDPVPEAQPASQPEPEPATEPTRQTQPRRQPIRDPLSGDLPTDFRDPLSGNMDFRNPTGRATSRGSQARGNAIDSIAGDAATQLGDWLGDNTLRRLQEELGIDPNSPEGREQRLNAGNPNHAFQPEGHLSTDLGDNSRGLVPPTVDDDQTVDEALDSDHPCNTYLYAYLVPNAIQETTRIASELYETFFPNPVTGEPDIPGLGISFIRELSREREEIPGDLTVSMSIAQSQGLIVASRRTTGQGRDPQVEVPLIWNNPDPLEGISVPGIYDLEPRVVLSGGNYYQEFTNIDEATTPGYFEYIQIRKYQTGLKSFTAQINNVEASPEVNRQTRQNVRASLDYELQSASLAGDSIGYNSDCFFPPTTDQPTNRDDDDDMNNNCNFTRYFQDLNRQMAELLKVTEQLTCDLADTNENLKGLKAVVKTLKFHQQNCLPTLPETYQASRQQVDTQAKLTFRAVTYRPGLNNSWTLTLHHFRYTQASQLPSFLNNFTYEKGEFNLNLNLKDHAPFVVNAKDKTEAVRVWNALKGLIEPNMYPTREPTVDDVKRNNGRIEFTGLVRASAIIVMDDDGVPLFRKSFPKPQ